MARSTAKKEKRQRPHPYAHERSPPEEGRLDDRMVTLFWMGLATITMFAGLSLADRYSTIVGSDPVPTWEQWTLLPLFSGLALLGFGFNRQAWSKRLTMGGWVLFGFYWALVAQDLFVKENQDYVNFTFALVGVYLFTYVAYHQWLSSVRGVRNDAVHFLNVATFVAAGAYFLIAKITPFRVWLINVVGGHTKSGLDLFGQGDAKGIQFIVDKQDSQGPVTFFYPDTYCDQRRGDLVGEYCREHDVTSADGQIFIHTNPDAPQNFLESWLQYAPAGEDLLIVPVSIILACTAIQSIMLFVGLFAGTVAPLRKKIIASLVVGAIIYILNLVRNVGIIWFYGQGHASFFVMHNVIGKGGSLVAFVAIAFAVFRFFPEFFKSLVGVIDLTDRDGPIERTLRIGRRRPEAGAGSAA